VLTLSITIKSYPACLCTPGGLDSVLHTVEEHGILPQNVEKVEVRTHPINVQLLMPSNPRSGLEGKFRMEYYMARVILDRLVGLEDFTDEKVLEFRPQDLVKRVKIVSHPTLTESGYLPLRC